MSSKAQTREKDYERGIRIADRRKEIGLSQDELAHRVGIGRQALSAIENGGDFKTQTLDNLAIVLGVSVDFIMYGKNEEKSELLSEASQHRRQRMRRKIKKMDCIEYLSVQAPLEKVNMLEDKQSKYIHEFVKRKEYSIVGKIRRNGFSQRDVDRQWNQIVNMIRKKQIRGVVVANMAAISSSVADAYFKVGLVIEAGGIVVTVDEGRLDMHIKKGA